jgi:tripartite-type tricarboxylate transporter receptor subunit TctC
MKTWNLRYRYGFCLALLLALLLGVESAALAQRYPTKAISLVVPFPAGGRTDLIGRIVAQHLQGHLNTTVVIVNKPGASGVLGSLEVRQAAPDGYMLGFFSTAFITAQYTVATPIVIKEYDLLAIVNVDPMAVAVNEAAPWKTLAQVVDYARRNPGKVRIGMIPGASAQIFAGALAKAAGGLKMIDVPFKGDADGAVALAGGHIDVHVAVPVAYKALVAAKKLRVLAVAAEERSPLYRDIATFRENGVDLVIGAFHGVYGPRGMPAEVRDTLISAIEKAVSSKELVEQMNTAGAGILFRKGEAATAFLAQQDATYRQIIEDLGMRTVPKK